MKLAILGAGMIVKDFLSMVGELSEIKLIAIIGVEQDLKEMENLSGKYSIKSVYTDFDDCLDNEDIDTVYVALPNHLHYLFSKKALLKNKNVICEKPFTLFVEELIELEKIAVERGLILVEAITNQYLTNYQSIKNDISEIGEVKMIECNLSQYSSRYDEFKKGNILPAFDPQKGGGALMDINIYNIHFVVGLLGKPNSVQYFANIENNIDTSGVLVLDYINTKAICIGAKDSSAEIRSTIQGTKGSITIDGPTNALSNYSLSIKNKNTIEVNNSTHKHRMFEEFKTFVKMVSNKELEVSKERMNHSKIVLEIINSTLKEVGLHLG